MSDNNCYLCQEPKSIVGHDTESCPNVKCKKCGQKGSNLSLNVDQKHDGNVCPREIKSENYDAQILDFVKEIGFSDDDIKPELELKEETLMTGRSGINKRPDKVDSIIPNDKEMMDFVHDIEFVNDIKPKLEIKEEPIDMKSSSVGIKRKPEFMEETLKVKSSKIHQKPQVAQNDKEILNILHDIEFSDDIKPKLEIKEEPNQ